MTPTQLLEHSECLHLMNPDDLPKLAQILKPLSFQAGQVLIREGKRSPGAFLVVEGELEVHKRLPGGTDRKMLSRVPKGEWVGMVSILDQEPATATIVAFSDVKVLAMDRANLETLRANNSPMSLRFGRNILACLAQQLARVNQNLLDLRKAVEEQ